MKVFLNLYAIVAIILKRFQTMNSQSHVALLLHDYTLLANNTKFFNEEFSNYHMWILAIDKYIPTKFPVYNPSHETFHN